MKVSVRPCAAAMGPLLLSRSAWAAKVHLPAPVLEWSFYVLLIFALGVAAFVFFRKSADKKKAPLSSMLGETRRPISSVHPDTSVTEAIRKMNSEKIGALLVMEDDNLTGIFTERDALNKVLAAGINPVSAKVSEVMTKDPYCVDPSTTVEQAMSIVTARRVRHLPVLRDGKLVGLVSSGDLTHWLVEDHDGEIQELVDIADRRRRC
ncbi:MAG: CBS domain-containing protein [Woeseia sp.]